MEIIIKIVIIKLIAVKTQKYHQIFLLTFSMHDLIFWIAYIFLLYYRLKTVMIYGVLLFLVLICIHFWKSQWLSIEYNVYHKLFLHQFNNIKNTYFDYIIYDKSVWSLNDNEIGVISKICTNYYVL